MGKKEETHDMLLRVATKVFIEKRSSNISLDEIAESAGVVRRTLYYHFKNKEALVLDVTKPIFTTGLNYIRSTLDENDITLESLCGLFIELWEKHQEDMELLYVIDFEDFDQLISLHRSFRTEFAKLIMAIDDPVIQLNRFKVAAIMFRCSFPILKNVSSFDRYKERFFNSINGLLKGLFVL